MKEEMIRRLVAAFQDLRRGYEQGKLSYPYSEVIVFRTTLVILTMVDDLCPSELINLLRHMRAYQPTQRIWFPRIQAGDYASPLRNIRTPRVSLSRLISHRLLPPRLWIFAQAWKCNESVSTLCVRTRGNSLTLDIEALRQPTPSLSFSDPNVSLLLKFFHHPYLHCANLEWHIIPCIINPGPFSSDILGRAVKGPKARHAKDNLHPYHPVFDLFLYHERFYLKPTEVTFSWIVHFLPPQIRGSLSPS